MVKNTKESGFLTNKKAVVFSYTPMAQDTKDSGKLAFDQVRGDILDLKEKCMRETGQTA